MIAIVSNMNYNWSNGEIKPYLKDIRINLNKYDPWKIQLTITISFVSSKSTNEEQIMY